jgi:hypothetical protein
MDGDNFNTFIYIVININTIWFIIVVSYMDIHRSNHPKYNNVYFML